MFNSIQVNMEDLILDSENPRFLVSGKSFSQDDIRKYLVEYEDVIDIALKINLYGGLLPGLRIIAVHENGAFIVLEGNRRVTACQILLNRQLAENPDFFPEITDTTRNNLENVEVDLVESREAALIVLANRHINDARQWPPIAKMRFFEKQFAGGKTVSEISLLTLIPEKDIKDDLRDYYRFLYARNLTCWSTAQKQLLDNFRDLKITKFTRIFSTSGSKKLKLTTNSQTYALSSKLPQTIFDQAIKVITEATLLTDEANTRSSLSNIPALMELLNNFSEPSSPINASDLVSTDDNQTTIVDGTEATNDTNDTDIADEAETAKDTDIADEVETTNDTNIADDEGDAITRTRRNNTQRQLFQQDWAVRHIGTFTFEGNSIDTLLRFLKDTDLNTDKTIDNHLVIALALRALIEHSTTHYYRVAMNKQASEISLARKNRLNAFVTDAAEHMKNSSKINLEVRKSISSWNRDVHSLQPVIHEPASHITADCLRGIAGYMKEFLDICFEQIKK